MYDEHFGLTGRPFQLTPDPAFWYETATHRRAMAYLGYGLAQGEGFIVITGDIGAGKTTLVGHLLDTLDREALNPIQLVSTAIEAADLLRIVATRLGVDTAGLEKAQLLLAIERGLHAVARTGRRTLLIVDEAQALPTSALEELRMLSNFQAGGHALLQIVLLGQPEFRSLLHGGERLEQLRQRVIAIHHLDPMAAGEVAAYVRHRLGVVGWNGRPQFADSAFAALHRHSDGVPRRLNQLANRVMLHAAVERTDVITAATVEAVAADLSADLPTMTPEAPAPFVAPMPVEEAAVADEAPARPADPVPTLTVVHELPSVFPAAEQRGEAVVEEPVAAVEPLAEVAEPVAEVAEPIGAKPARPFRHSWLSDPDSVPAAPAMDPAAVEPVAPIVEAVPAAGHSVPLPEDAPRIEATPAAEPAPVDAMAVRLAALEARIEEQDAALRRVLTLMVDWVEGGETSRAVEPAAPAAAAGYAPIRGAAAA